MTREIETWLSDCMVGDDSVVAVACVDRGGRVVESSALFVETRRRLAAPVCG